MLSNTKSTTAKFKYPGGNSSSQDRSARAAQLKAEMTAQEVGNSWLNHKAIQQSLGTQRELEATLAALSAARREMRWQLNCSRLYIYQCDNTN